MPGMETELLHIAIKNKPNLGFSTMYKYLKALVNKSTPLIIKGLKKSCVFFLKLTYTAI